MNARVDLIAAKALIDTPEKWKERDLQRAVWTTCSGALARADECRAVLIGALSHDDLRGFNDAPETTHADIMALFDRAIEAAK